MKKYIFYLIFLSMSVILPTSCEQYLDKAPEQGLTEDQIFSRLSNFRLFFNAVYEGQSIYNGNARDFNIKVAYPLYFNYWDQKYTWDGITDAADQGRFMEGQTLKSGAVAGFVDKFINDGNRRPILKSMFMVIRECNIALQKVDMIQDATESEKNDLIAQAHFVRAFAHFELFKIWGPMPYITSVIGSDDQWDIPRLSKHETCIRIAQDFDTAYNYFVLAGKVRRDPGPGLPGHLQDPDQARPNGCAAKAFKAKALLYAASPLNTEGAASDWTNAAAAAWDALQLALANGYAMLTPAAERIKNFWGSTYTNEEIWAWNAGSKNWNSGDFAGLFNGVFGNSTASWSGVCPTQNWVDKYETADGRALNTQADRDVATTALVYNEQDPYTGRDPRLAQDIIYNQSPATGWASGKAQIWYSVNPSTGAVTYSELLNQTFLGITRTGYYQRKFWGNNSNKNQITVQHTCPLMRMAELYLMFAEASNEAYGPTTVGVTGAISAEAAVNIVRARVGQVPVRAEYLASKDIFRARVKNEINVELGFEGQYFFDIRRWKDAPAAYSSTLTGFAIEKMASSAAPYITGYKYTRVPLSSDRQVSWKEPMYYLPFNTSDNFKMKIFVPNVVW
jgi:hypothetical protein